nr:hypothetical protein [Pedobacter sp. ASV19]
MGQYYKPVNLDKQEFASCYDYGNGAKRTEHSCTEISKTEIPA